MTGALVVLSGGQDSTTCLFYAKLHQKHWPLHAVTFDYGQLHRRELQSARDVAGLANVVSHEVITLPPGVLASVSPLVDHGQKLEQYNNHDEMERIIGDRVELTFVPLRNALFLTIAANRAVALGCKTIVTGVCQADNANYPDCRQAFVFAQESTINEALGFTRVDGKLNECIHIEAPLISTPKHESVKLALTLSGCYQALAWSHTAYDGSYPPTGKDHATVLRAHSFEQANVPDPLLVRAWLEGVLPGLPDSPNYFNHRTALIAAQRASTLSGIPHTLGLLEHHFKQLL